MDIRSFFSPKSSATTSSRTDSSGKTKKKTEEGKGSGSKRKRIQRIDSSDDEDFENAKTRLSLRKADPSKKQVSPKNKKDVSSKAKSGKHNNLKPVNVDEFFGAKKEESCSKEDSDLTAVLHEMDDDFDEESPNPPSKKMKRESPLSKEKPDSPAKKTAKQEGTSSKKNTKERLKKEGTSSQSSSPKDKPLSLAKKLASKKRSYEIEIETPTKIKKTPIKTPGKVDEDEVPGTPQEDYDEMKKKHQTAYKQFLTRGGARNPGSKEIPEIVPGCLDKLVFVLTGVYDSLERDEMSDIIRQCGGKTTTSLSRNTTYIVVGDQPGESKLKKADSIGTTRLDEDGLLKLICEKAKVHSKKFTPKEEIKPNVKSTKKSEKTREASPKSDYSKVKKQPVVMKEESKSPLKTKLPPVVKKVEQVVHSKVKSESSEDIPKRNVVFTDSRLWVDKYKPGNLKSIIGQQGDRSNMKKLLEWLKNWSKYHGAGPNKQKPPPRPSPWATGGDNGGWAKCALLSGPPGVGKTTTASLVCRDLGFDIMELNASDGRSKKTLEASVKEALSSMSLSSTSTKRVLLMDEVDGMAGNEDRGGIATLILLLKSSKIPIICMCNDRNHEKIRSLANHCFDLRFQRPRTEQIKAAMMSICFKEKIKVSSDAMTELIGGCNNDVRQVLHHLSMIKARDTSGTQSMTKEEAKAEAKMSQKTSIKLGPWDVCKKVFSAQEHSSMSLFDKSDLFFYDFSIGPLFVQENYLSVTPEAAKKDKRRTMELISLAANSICCGDLVEKTIRSKNAWNLLPVNAIYASVLPGEYMSGYLHGQIQFPSWLGKNSKQNKMNRILQELASHTRLTTGANKRNIGFDYAQHLQNSITGPLTRLGASGIEESIRVMEAYSLQREDLDSLIEYSSWPGREDPMKSVESKVKSAFTRAYNKEVSTLPYSIQQTASKKKAGSASLSLEEGQEDLVSEEEEDGDDIGSDAMIKAKPSKASSSKKGKNESKSSASTSRSKKTKDKKK